MQILCLKKQHACMQSNIPLVVQWAGFVGVPFVVTKSLACTTGQISPLPVKRKEKTTC